MSPGYENRVTNALEILKGFYGSDLTSIQAKVDYKLCLKLLRECNNNLHEATIRFKLLRENYEKA